MPVLSDKIYLSAQGLLEDSWELAARVIEDDFRPSYIVAIWRGAMSIGIAVQEMLEYHGVKTDHIAIRTSSYSGIEARESRVSVYGLD